MYLKIGDFGEALVMNPLSPYVHTKNVGTTEFRAPEVFGDSKSARVEYTTKADGTDSKISPTTLNGGDCEEQSLSIHLEKLTIFSFKLI